MLEVRLDRLDREGTVLLEESVPVEDAISLRGLLWRACRRCLDPVRQPVDQDLTLIWAEAGDPRGSDDEMDALPEGVRPLPVGSATLDLREAIREEVLLDLDRFVLCDPDCRGLCARCGADLNEETCSCDVEEVDPRWEDLLKLKEK